MSEPPAPRDEQTDGVFVTSLDVGTEAEFERALAALSDAVRAGSATRLVIEFGDQGEQFAGAFDHWLVRHEAVLRASVDCVVFVHRGLWSRFMLLLLGYTRSIPTRWRVMRSRERAVAWAATM